jgi:hypothetical protein
MIVLRGYEILVMQSNADLASDDIKKASKGTLYLTNMRLVFETESGTILSDTLLDHIRSVESVTDHELAVSYNTDRTDKASRDTYIILDQNIHKKWMNAFKNVLDARS